MYYDLAQCLTGDCAVYGLQTVISDKDNVSIKEMAKRYLDVVQKQVPDGEYVFAGWSMGALVAYEMGVQYKKSNNRAPMVIILDQQPPDINLAPIDTLLTPLERLTIFTEKLGQLAGRKINITKEALEKLSPKEQSALFLKEFKNNNMVTEDTHVNDFHGFLEKMILHNDITIAHKAETYDGKVLLIKANDSTFTAPFSTNEKKYGWNNYAENVIVGNVPGNHIAMMKLPEVKMIAKVVNYLSYSIM